MVGMDETNQDIENTEALRASVTCFVTFLTKPFLERRMI
jgi:hypothetical protein